MSHQEFLKGQLEMLTLFQAKTDREIELENLVRFNIQTVEKCTEVMKTMNQFILELMEGDEAKKNGFFRYENRRTPSTLYKRIALSFSATSINKVSGGGSSINFKS